MLIDNLADLIVLGQLRFEKVPDQLQLKVAEHLISKGFSMLVPYEFRTIHNL